MTLGAQSATLLMLLCLVPIVGLTGYTLYNLENPGARGLLLALIGVTGWTILLAMLTWPGRLLPVFVNTAARQVFQFATAAGWLLFVFEYVRQERIDLTRWYVPVLLIVPAVTIGLTATNPLHNAVIGEGTPPNPAGAADLQLGAPYLLFVLYTFAVVTLPIVLLLYELRSAHGPYRKQLLLMLAGWAIGVPAALNVHVLRWFDAIPSFVDLTPIGFVIAAVLWSMALYRYDLFGMVPISRRRAVETMDDPVISVDAHGTVVDANPAARKLCGRSDEVIGTPFRQFCDAYPPIIDLYERGGKQHEEVTLSVDGRGRHFLLQLYPIGETASVSGSLLVLRETTELRERERELDLLKQVFSRVFRHNIRNDLTVLQGHVQAIEDGDDGTFEEHTTILSETVDDLLAHSEKATELRDVIDMDADSVTADIGQLVRREVDEFQTQYPSVDVETSIEEGIAGHVHPRISAAVTELLENARLHFEEPADRFRLRVTVSQEGDTASIVVADNGRGIDTQEIKALRAGEETALQHGSGVGLWMVQLIVGRSNGTLAIREDPDLGGARITLSIPLAETAGRPEHSGS